MQSENLPVIKNAQGLVDALIDNGNVIDHFPPEHIFSEGLYTRVLNIPAQHFCVGKVHRHKTLNILLEGELICYVSENQPPKLLKAPMIFESEAGTRKIGIAITDVKFANVHVTTETDLFKLEEEFTIPESELLLDSSLDNFRLQLLEDN